MFITANSCLLPVSKNPPDYFSTSSSLPPLRFPPLRHRFPLLLLYHRRLFRQRQPRSASGVSPVANFRLASLEQFLLVLARGPFLGSDRQVVAGYTGYTIRIAVNGRGRSHLRQRLRPRAFGHFQLPIDFYYNSFYFICIISFSGLHVLE